jgi:hypothetical protein
MTVMAVFMVAVVMMSMTVVAAAPAVAIVGFVERELIAHPNIKFAHSISLFAAGLAAEENIINNSSFFKQTIASQFEFLLFYL